MSYRKQLANLHALAEQRRNNGEPCNPRRDGVDVTDWLSELELQAAQALMWRAELARRCEGVAA